MYRLASLLLLTVAYICAEETGDFAPLTIGNTWVYDLTYNATFAGGPVTRSDTLVITYTLYNQLLHNDTTFHCFRISYSGTLTKDSSAVHTVVSVDSSILDSLGETGSYIQRHPLDTVSTQSPQPPLFWHLPPVLKVSQTPVYAQHTLDTASLLPPLQTAELDGKSVLLFFTNSGTAFSKQSFFYRQDTGLALFTWERYSEGMTGWRVSETQKLRSFVNTPPTSSEAIRHTPPEAAPRNTITTSLELPRFSILVSGTTFDLLGRVDKRVTDAAIPRGGDRQSMRRLTGTR